MMYKTPAEWRAASKLNLCYTDEQLRPLCGRPLLEVLLEVPPADACWFLAGALPQAARCEWAAASARRAREYADSARAYAAAAAADDAYAASAARAAARAASAASTAAARAAAYAASANWAAHWADHAAASAAAAYSAERRIAICHGVMLLERANSLKSVNAEPISES